MAATLESYSRCSLHSWHHSSRYSIRAEYMLLPVLVLVLGMSRASNRPIPTCGLSPWEGLFAKHDRWPLVVFSTRRETQRVLYLHVCSTGRAVSGAAQLLFQAYASILSTPQRAIQSHAGAERSDTAPEPQEGCWEVPRTCKEPPSGSPALWCSLSR